MKAQVVNYGRPMPFNTRAGNIRVPRMRPFIVHDPRIVEDLRKYPYIKIRILEGALGKPLIDYSSYRINELRNIAAGLGIEGSFFMKKPELIKRLEESNGISTC